MTTHEQQALALLGQILSEPPEVDPFNPWPPGCDWWHRHNEIYREAQRKRRVQR